MEYLREVDETSESQQKDILCSLGLGQEWDLVTDLYKIEKVIGCGSSGIVVRAKDRLRQHFVAIKHVKGSFREDNHHEIKKVIREVQILRHLT